MNAEAEDAAPPAPEPEKTSAEQAALPARPEASEAKAKVASSPRGGVVEWFWGRRAMKAARAHGSGPSAVGLAYQREANLCIELARNALEPLQPLEFGPAQASACELYRQAIYWALLAESTATAKPEGKNSFDEVWDGSDRALLLKAAGGNAAQLDSIGQALKGKGFADFADLSPAAARELSTTLRQFAEALVDALDPAQLEVERIWLRRMTRVGTLLGLAVFALVTSVFVADARERARDVARGKPWEISTNYGEGCASPDQTCENSPQFFFHTLEQNDPWFIVDLQEPTSISGLRVDNRGECCLERAIPLVVEVSTDRQNWSEVARRTTEFGTWRVSFAPVQARYVRLHVPRVTNLHLKRVRVLR
ncbi:MAG TPA: discoidin domain-containing protein [Polyangiaceae bacterium]|nr:discoidin domain-containing protein [Polyangiaceae bacterium]